MSALDFAYQAIAGLLALAVSFALSVLLAFPLSIRSPDGNTPDWFPVVVKSPTGALALRNYSDLASDRGLASGDRFLLSPSEVVLLNKDLAREASGKGANRKVELLEQQGERQYVHIRLAGDDDISEGWYWATTNGIEPAYHRWLNPGVLLIVCPMTLVLAGCILCAGWRLGKVARCPRAD